MIIEEAAKKEDVARKKTKLMKKDLAKDKRVIAKLETTIVGANKDLKRDKRVIAKLEKTIVGANLDRKRDRLIIEEATKKEDVARKIRRTLTTKKEKLKETSKEY